MKLSLLLWGFFFLQYFVEYLSIFLSSLVKHIKAGGRTNLFILVRKSDLYKLHE